MYYCYFFNNLDQKQTYQLHVSRHVQSYPATTVLQLDCYKHVFLPKLNFIYSYFKRSIGTTKMSFSPLCNPQTS